MQNIMGILPLTKLYYAIGEVADMFHLAPSVIRYWESEFTQLHPAKNSKGERKFTAKDIETIEQIFHLVKEKGFTIEGAKKEMEAEKQVRKDNNALLQKLKNLKSKIEAYKDGL